VVEIVDCDVVGEKVTFCFLGRFDTTAADGLEKLLLIVRVGDRVRVDFAGLVCVLTLLYRIFILTACR
jgi:hypothetical protein